ncbi:PKS-NRPS hybrid synthetase cheA-like [Bidens hawaiensis]|uniref:PKS-NRPS hybrid synthetase cheA-like n=1 Tax=Bidens hawaiensis TaxID=980011 RepID=UPI0040494D02
MQIEYNNNNNNNNNNNDDSSFFSFQLLHMSTFYENDSMGYDEIIMTTPQFATNQVFRSREDLVEWVQKLGYSLGVVVVTKRSNKRPCGFVFKVVLICDRGGKYRVQESSKASGTKKINCPFELEGRYSDEYDAWTLTVICDGHNHQRSQYMEGHAYARRLTDDERSWVAYLTKMNVAPHDILSLLKERNLSNVSTIKTIYNERNKIRLIEQEGKSPMQVLLSFLHDNNYVYEFTTTGLNELENIFFVQPTSFNIWRAFPHILIIDATYKTNKYNMPFVQIVGVTSTNNTFSIAFAFMHNEKTVNYTWVLNCLKLTLDKCMLPRVIVTDRELALVNACKEVFPDAAQLLCRWHIEQNIFRRCRNFVRSRGDWDKFSSLWKSLVDSATLESYTENYQILESFLIKFPRVSDYVNKNWLKEYKKMFVSLWIDQHLNFGENTTNRVESAHAKLKKFLETSNSGFDKFVTCVDQIVKSQHTIIKASLGTSRIQKIHQHDLQCFKLLHGFVSIEALELLKKECKRLNEDRVDCDCRLRTCKGLPCACELSMFISSGQYIPLYRIDVFWRKLDVSPLTSMQDDDVDCDNELQNTAEQTYFTNTARVTEYDFMGLSQHSVTCQKSIDYRTYIGEIPEIFQPYVEDIENVDGDGNCGFRATAVALGYHQNDWASIRRSLIEEMVQYEQLYRLAFNDKNNTVDEYNAVFSSLNWFGKGFAPTQYWMIMPETGYLIANRFNVIFHFISKDNNSSSTIFPLWRGPDQFPEKRIITMALVHSNHYVAVKMQGEFPMGVTQKLWTLNRQTAASEWEQIYQSRQQLYKDWIWKPPVYKVID